MRTNVSLPTFFVIGAPKAGTTSLHEYLGGHPEVEMSRVKEPFVFARPDYGARLAEYGSLFTGIAAVRGESSTVYSQYPHFGDVAERIAAVVPEAKFVYLVRDPIDRAVAHYVQHVADGKEERSLSEAMSGFEDPAHTYLAASRYATQLGLYLKRFEADRILVLVLEDLSDDAAATMERVYAFLGLAPGPRNPLLGRRLNRREDQRVPTALGARLADFRMLEIGRGVPLPGVLRARLARAVSRRPQVRELPPSLRADLAAHLADEVAWLRRFTGRDLGGWSL